MNITVLSILFDFDDIHSVPSLKSHFQNQKIFCPLSKTLESRYTPPYLRAHIQELHVSDYNLRGYTKLEIPHVKTTTYGLRSFRYFAPHAWNNLTDSIRMLETLPSFKRSFIEYI